MVVRAGRILAQSFNLRETFHDPTAHAERLALTWAGRGIGSWRLDNCVLYVTLEPCADAAPARSYTVGSRACLRSDGSQGGGLRKPLSPGFGPSA